MGPWRGRESEGCHLLLVATALGALTPLRLSGGSTSTAPRVAALEYPGRELLIAMVLHSHTSEG